jgi:tetratricopeptide (TPR) repeat protein
MALPLTCFTALLLAQTPAPVSRPIDIVWTAMRSIERDSAGYYRARWEADLTRNPSDRRTLLGIAVLDRFEYRHAAATEKFQRLIANPPSADPYTPYAWLELGWLNLWRLAFDSTRTVVRHGLDAARAINDSVAQAEALSILGFLESRLAGPDAGLLLLRQALEILPRDQRAEEAIIRCILPPILSFGGRQEAVAEGRRGLELARESGDLRVQGICYQGLAQVMTSVSERPADADLLLDSAIAVQRAAHDRELLSITLFTKGFNRLNAYDLGGSKRFLLEAITEARASGSDFSEAWSRRMLSRLHWITGNVSASEREFRQAAVLFEGLRDSFALGGVQVGLAAAAIAQGRLDEAERILRARLAVTRRIGQAEGELGNRTMLASIKAARGDWAGARADYEDAARFAARTGHEGWLPYYQYAGALSSLRMGDLDRAEREFKAYLASGVPGALERYGARSRMAELLVRRGDTDGALIEINEATDQLDSIRNRMDDHELKLLVFQTRDDLDEPDLGLATIVAGLVRGGRVADAFRLTERRRARTLADKLLQAELLREDSSGSHLARTRIEADSGNLGALVPDDRTAVLEFLAGRRGQPSTAFVLTRSDIRATVLPSLDSLEPLLLGFIRAVQANPSQSAGGETLRRVLLDSVLASLPPGVTRLLLVPDDLLHRVPFDALPLTDGRPLLSRYATGVVPSAGIASRLYARRRVDETPRLLAVGDPRFPEETTSGDATTEIYRSAFEESGGLPRLSASAGEARLAARFSPAPVLRLRDDASEAYLKHTELTGFHVIHVASHALVDERTLERTAIALAPGAGEDGFMSAGDLSALRLDADLVVLSACRTAGGVVVGGEGVQGLVSPLLSAGARSVVATMWPVGDRSTARLVEDFYRELANGNDVAEALRQAKLAAIERGAPPAEWAAFNVTGDPLVQVRLRHPSGREPWVPLAGGVLLLTLFLVILRARTRVRA